MGTFEDHFGKKAQLILQRRSSDAELDEICRDFELLVADIRNVGPGDRSWKSELENSLAGLKGEILTRLERS